MHNVETEFSVFPCATMGDGDADERSRLERLLTEADAFLRRFKWCKSVRERYFGMGVGDVVGVFLFRIDNAAAPDDEWLWVVVGDCRLRTSSSNVPTAHWRLSRHTSS